MSRNGIIPFQVKVGAGVTGNRQNRFKFSHWNIKTEKGKVYGGTRLAGVIQKAKDMGGCIQPMIRKCRPKVMKKVAA